eukprot:CAMPEP_0205832930 /NCGR_PEP_ID=MMETSP0206-20130828/48286_1 /ASSEMBLY_ACC=CAM_ASM_000279 /TAXON_ID=36767 /ORGANISM="Euplotes focardii, Strain TN1" /LENGTH=44 /DNA_ID= /DNA_START= /DNA_END= /DNA_ORIENTATION=
MAEEKGAPDAKRQKLEQQALRPVPVVLCGVGQVGRQLLHEIQGA